MNGQSWGILQLSQGEKRASVMRLLPKAGCQNMWSAGWRVAGLVDPGKNKSDSIPLSQAAGTAKSDLQGEQ